MPSDVKFGEAVLEPTADRPTLCGFVQSVHAFRPVFFEFGRGKQQRFGFRVAEVAPVPGSEVQCWLMFGARHPRGRKQCWSSRC